MCIKGTDKERGTSVGTHAMFAKITEDGLEVYNKYTKTNIISKYESYEAFIEHEDYEIVDTPVGELERTISYTLVEAYLIK